MEKNMESQTNDTEQLTPKQIKNRLKKQRAREKKQNTSIEQSDNNGISVKPNNKDSQGQERKKDVNKKPRMTNEEFEAELLKKKLTKLEKNSDTVVAITNSVDARALAFKIDELSLITDKARNSFGPNKDITPQDAVGIIDSFYTDVMGGVEKFLELSHSKGLGLPREIDSYKEKQRKLKVAAESEQNRIRNIAKNNQAMLLNSIALENEAEKKSREKEQKELDQVQEKISKLQESIAKAQEELKQTQENLESIKAQNLETLATRYAAQKQRVREQKELEQKQEEAKTADDTSAVA
jgi:hypothetical protein